MLAVSERSLCCGSFWLDLDFQTCLWVVWTTKRVVFGWFCSDSDLCDSNTKKFGASSDSGSGSLICHRNHTVVLINHLLVSDFFRSDEIFSFPSLVCRHTAGVRWLSLSCREIRFTLLCLNSDSLARNGC